MPNFSNIFHLGIKELRSLYRDPVLSVFILLAFTVLIFVAGKGASLELNNAPIAIVDEDRSPLSLRLINSLYPPYFKKPEVINFSDIDQVLDKGRYTFVMVIPTNFHRDTLAAKQPELQLNVDATQMTQAFIGAGYIQAILNGEINEYLQGYRAKTALPVELALRVRFNPTLTSEWFGGVMELINIITMLSVILTGAALIREREHGTLEHLLVMPLTPAEIMFSKVWAMALVVLLASILSLYFVIKGLLGMPIAGSVPLFILAAALMLFSTTSLGIFLGTVARTMPQLGLLMLLIIMPMQMLSGGATPYESMPEAVQYIMLGAPTTHFVRIAQAILYRGAGFETVWPNFVMIFALGAVFFSASLLVFRRSLAAES
ncbi:MAG: ABC transporter permease [Gammaproteobacteria bacterium]|nr:ABC transporter permease [Gammaproteobacteria bacterium]